MRVCWPSYCCMKRTFGGMSMTTGEIMNLDFRKEESREIVQKVLRKIRPLAKCSEEEDVPMEMLEKVVRVVCLKYNVWVYRISQDIHANENETIWSALLVNDADMKDIGYVYGISMYELFAKMAIKLHSLVRGEKLELRKPSKQEKQRERKARRIGE